MIATAREGDKTAAAGIVLGALVDQLAARRAGHWWHSAAAQPARPAAGRVGRNVAAADSAASSSTPCVGIGAVLLFAGAGVSPALIAGFALAARLVPESALTQALTWASDLDRGRFRTRVTRQRLAGRPRVHSRRVLGGDHGRICCHSRAPC